MQLEGKGLNGVRMFKQTGVAPDETLPLMLIAQLQTMESVAYYDASMPAELLDRLAACLPEIGSPHVEPLLGVLESQAIRAGAEHYQTFLFPTPPPAFTDRIVVRYAGGDPRLQAVGFDGFRSPVFGIEQDGVVLAACVSVRENDHCGEAWVFTSPEHRRQGLATRVVNAWARSLLQAGKIPFYSCQPGDLPSAGLAHRLGLQPVFEQVDITALN